MQDVKILGLPAEKGRWLLVLFGIIIFLCTGAVYSWSVFRKPLEQMFNISATKSSLPYMLFLVCFAGLMPITGGFIDKYGPRIITLIGGIVIGLGWILAGMGNNITVLTLSYGLLAGGGVGIVYGVPLSVSARWFPDKKGIAVGLTLTGFGLSAFITAPLAAQFISLYGLLKAFIILGIIFFILIVSLSFFLSFPPSDWKPEEVKSSVKKLNPAIDLNRAEMLRTTTFYALWIPYIIGTLAGLTTIGISVPVATEIIKMETSSAVKIVSLFALFNCVGRPLFGWLADRYKPRTAAVISFVIIFLASTGMLQAREGSSLLYILCFSGFWLCLGGWLAIAPTATALFFGVQHYAQNYGVMYTAYGIGAILGNLISGRLRDLMGSYIYTFYPTAILAIAGILIVVFWLKPPRRQVEK